MELKLINLEKCIEEATKQNRKYIGVKIQTEGYDEVIINPTGNFSEKLEYYKNAYNDNLTLKSFGGIKIIGFTFGDTYESIEDDLV